MIRIEKTFFIGIFSILNGVFSILKAIFEGANIKCSGLQEENNSYELLNFTFDN